jgi:NADP-reducing hydrogenase subunit HndB
MKSIQELEAIRQKTLETINLRKEQNGTRVVVGMATCGIRPARGLC